jgi:hypothetical protein
MRVQRPLLLATPEVYYFFTSKGASSIEAGEGASWVKQVRNFTSLQFNYSTLVRKCTG